MNFLIRIIISALTAFGLSYLLDGVEIDKFTTALILALVLAVLNALVKPILIILTLPITIITLGLFLLVINALIIIIADRFIDGFNVQGFWWALLFSILLSLVSSILYSAGKKKED
jgi:putative membrane protein